jgi:PAS domain S-box-containing protein
MDNITIIWSMTAAACLTLAGIQIMVVIQKKTDLWQLLFVSAAVSAAVMAWFELSLMHTTTVDEAVFLVRWAQVPFGILLMSIVWLVALQLRPKNFFLAWLAAAMRIAVLVLNFSFGVNVNFREITGIKHIAFLGEIVSVPAGVTNPWALIGQISGPVMWMFCLYAGVQAWRQRGDRSGLRLGISTAFFLAFVTFVRVLVVWGISDTPYAFSPIFLIVLAVIAFELSFQASRSSKLESELEENQERMNLAFSAAQLGLWVRDLVKDEIWASNEWRELFGFEKNAALDLDKVLERIHPDDREHVRAKFLGAVEGDGAYVAEYRIVRPDGIRWIASHGRTEFDRDHRPIAVRGASLDITARREAEDAAHELSGQLINAQENERARVARELHDDLSQHLALLSIELSMFGKSVADHDSYSTQVNQLTDRVGQISADLRRLSHELHPSMLQQIGLVSAVRNFCDAIESSHGISLEFSENDVPRTLPEDLTLCCYRIVQESVHDVVKHSGASWARVELCRSPDQIQIRILDNGFGFDTAAAGKGTLGLVSMRERIRLLNGSFDIRSDACEGTVVEAKIPIVTPVQSVAGSSQ